MLLRDVVREGPGSLRTPCSMSARNSRCMVGPRIAPSEACNSVMRASEGERTATSCSARASETFGGNLGLAGQSLPTLPPKLRILPPWPPPGACPSVNSMAGRQEPVCRPVVPARRDVHRFRTRRANAQCSAQAPCCVCPPRLPAVSPTAVGSYPPKEQIEARHCRFQLPQRVVPEVLRVRPSSRRSQGSVNMVQQAPDSTTTPLPARHPAAWPSSRRHYSNCRCQVRIYPEHARTRPAPTEAPPGSSRRTGPRPAGHVPPPAPVQAQAARLAFLD